VSGGFELSGGKFMSRKRLFLGVLVAFALIAAGCKVTVTPTAPHTWFFLNEGANGTGYLTNGPGTPPSGRGSALLTVDANGREDIGTLYFKGQSLSSISKLQYSTYQAYSGSPNEAPTLQFDVDYDKTDDDNSFQGRLVFIPSASAPIVPNSWQTWDTLTGPATGVWYSSASGASVYRPIVGDVRQETPPCDQVNYCTWDEVKTDYPNARIRPNGLLAVRAGGPVTGGLSAATDDVIVGLGGTDIESDFEPGDGTIPVTTSNASKLSFGFSQETATGSGSFVTGPTGSDGSGSARLTVDATGGEALSTGVFAGTRFDRLTALSYKTYLQPGFPVNAPTLQFDVDYDDSDANTTFQGRVVFEPRVAGAAPVTDSNWQTWDPLTTPSGWWQTGNAIVGGVNVGMACTQNVPCSWADFKTAYGNARVRPIVGVFPGAIPNSGRAWLKVGGNWGGTGFDGNVDTLTVGIDNADATYDLEP
jgi:hypothetical protein